MSEKTNALRDAGFVAVAAALDANAARTTEALWSSVDEILAENAARLGAPVEVPIPTIQSVGQRNQR